MWIEGDGTWRMIAPTEPGARPGTTGGDMVMWVSKDQGARWVKVRQLTRGRAGRNHTYAKKPVEAHRDFYALWADGDPLARSGSSLYYTNREGTGVWRLPEKMKGEWAKPERVR